MTNTGKIESYIQERIDQYYRWYSDNAKKSKKKYQFNRSISAISAVLIPVITNLTLKVEFHYMMIDIGKILVTILGLAVALLVALEGVFHYKEQWVNYRSTAEYLKTQKILFLHMSEDYEGLEEKKAFTQLVNRIEKAIAEENAVTLNVLTRAEQKSNN